MSRQAIKSITTRVLRNFVAIARWRYARDDNRRASRLFERDVHVRIWRILVSGRSLQSLPVTRSARFRSSNRRIVQNAKCRYRRYLSPVRKCSWDGREERSAFDTLARLKSRVLTSKGIRQLHLTLNERREYGPKYSRGIQSSKAAVAELRSKLTASISLKAPSSVANFGQSQRID